MFNLKVQLKILNVIKQDHIIVIALNQIMKIKKIGQTNKNKFIKKIYNYLINNSLQNIIIIIKKTKENIP